MKKLTWSKRLAAVLLSATMAFGLVACGSTNTTDSASDQEAVSTSESESADAEVSYPLTVTDSNGDEITIESEPQKVVSVAPNLTEMMYELGVSDKLVGRSDYCDYPDEVSELPSVGTITEPDIEAIIAMEPDVVIVSTHFDEENTKKLEDLSIPVITLYEESEMEGVYDMITTLGTVMNCTAAAAQCVTDMKQTITEVQSAVSEEEPVSVYYVVGYGEYGDYTAGGDTFVGNMLDMAGGDNIAKDISGWSITTEELLEADPDVIIIAESMKDDFMQTEPYTELTAVKEGNVYTLDTNMLDRQGYRNAEGIKAIAEILHPDQFK